MTAKKKKRSKQTNEALEAASALPHKEHEHHHEHGEHHEKHEHHHEHDHHHEEHEHRHEHDHHHEEHEHRHEHGEHCGCGHDHGHEHGEHCGCGHEHEHHEHKHKDAGHADRTVTFTLNGLDCPHCASQIEAELEKNDDIVSAEINLITSRLTVGLSKGYSGSIKDETVRSVKKFEPDVEVTANGEDTKASLTKTLRSEKATFIRFGIGAALYAAGLLLSRFGGASVYIYLPVLIAAYLILGYDVLWGAVRNIFKGRVFDEKFLMTVSTVGAFAIGEYPEAVAVMLFYQIGEFFQSLAVRRSRRSISDLMDIRPDSANVMRGGELVTIAPESVKLGETIVIKPGEKVPLDGEITDGETTLDTRALTGEAVPRSARVGDTVLSGCINETGVISVKVTKTFGESTAAKILDLVENAAGRKAPTENFISVFARYYTPIVVALALALAMIPPLVLHGGWAMWVRRCFVFLVISCPCALVISIPLTFFGGIGAASRSGVLVKGSNYLEALNSIDTVVFDKTGTLTRGEFAVTKITPAEGIKESDVLSCGAAAEKLSNHPIARSIVAAHGGADDMHVSGYREIPGHGVCARYDGREILAGNARLMKDNGITAGDTSESGTVVHIAADKKYLGSIVISDRVKPNSRKAIYGLRELGVSKTVMLTGDNETAAKHAAEELGIDEYHAGLLPADKVQLVEALLEQHEADGKRVAFVGDGINDAPVLARADVGVAMGALGSDAAIEAADVVLMNDDPLSLCSAVKIAARTKHIVTQNIVMVLAVKAVILVLGALGLAGMWVAVFGDVGIMVIAVLNAMRVLPKRKSEDLG